MFGVFIFAVHIPWNRRILTAKVWARTANRGR